jgi:predicted ATPase
MYVAGGSSRWGAARLTWRGCRPFSPCAIIFVEKEENILAWRRAPGLGSNAGPLAKWFPQLGLILGEPRAVQREPARAALSGRVEEVSGVQAQEHSQRLIHNFLAVFQDHPLVIFLDDLQWADQASLDLLVALSQAADLPALLLIGAYRMVHAAHPLALAVEKIKAAARPGARTQSLHIVALELETITQFLADALHTGPQEVSELAQVVLARSCLSGGLHSLPAACSVLL